MAGCDLSRTVFLFSQPPFLTTPRGPSAISCGDMAAMSWTALTMLTFKGIATTFFFRVDRFATWFRGTVLRLDLTLAEASRGFGLAQVSRCRILARGPMVGASSSSDDRVVLTSPGFGGPAVASNRTPQLLMLRALLSTGARDWGAHSPARAARSAEAGLCSRNLEPSCAAPHSCSKTILESCVYKSYGTHHPIALSRAQPRDVSQRSRRGAASRYCRAPSRYLAQHFTDACQETCMAWGTQTGTERFPKRSKQLPSCLCASGPWLALPWPLAESPGMTHPATRRQPTCAPRLFLHPASTRPRYTARLQPQ